MSWQAISWVQSLRGLPATVKQVAEALASNAGPTGDDIRASDAYICERTGRSRSTVRRARAWLVENGILEVVQRSEGFRRANRHRMPVDMARVEACRTRKGFLAADPGWTKVVDRIEELHCSVGSSWTNEMAHNEPTALVHSEPLSLRSLILKKEPTPIVPIASAPPNEAIEAKAEELWNAEPAESEAAQDEGTTSTGQPRPVDVQASFDRFWRLWPRKHNRPAAWRAYRRAISDGATPADIMGALMRWMAEEGHRENRFQPYPHRWIGRAPWFDDLAEREAEAELELALAGVTVAEPRSPTPPVTAASDALVTLPDTVAPVEAWPSAAKPDPEGLAEAIEAWNIAAARHGLAAAGADDLTPAAQTAIASRHARGDLQAAISALDASPAARRLVPSLNALAAMAAEPLRWTRFVS